MWTRNGRNFDAKKPWLGDLVEGVLGHERDEHAALKELLELLLERLGEGGQRQVLGKVVGIPDVGQDNHLAQAWRFRVWGAGSSGGRTRCGVKGMGEAVTPQGPPVQSKGPGRGSWLLVWGFGSQDQVGRETGEVTYPGGRWTSLSSDWLCAWPGGAVQGIGCRVQGARCRVQDAGCRVQCAVCSVQCAWCRVHGARRHH